MNDQLIIYRDLTGYCVTPLSNYRARIQDARKITKCYDFDNPDEIISYYCKWFKSSPTDFIIKEA